MLLDILTGVSLGQCAFILFAAALILGPYRPSADREAPELFRSPRFWLATDAGFSLAGCIVWMGF